MPAAMWSDQFVTGIELIDAQHKELFVCLNQLFDAIKDNTSRQTLQESLASLARRTIKHFQTEESLMKEIGYPTRCAHSELHNELILKVRAVQYEQAKGQAPSLEVARYLAGWFDHHIVDVDLGYVEYMKNMKS